MTVEDFRKDQIKYLDGFVNYWNKFVELESFGGKKELDIEEWLEQFETYCQYIFGDEEIYSDSRT